MYEPKPVDTTDIILPKDMMPLMEKLAENVHNVWASQRIKDGWCYGKQRDDANKITPCLVPYVDLPESEKVYDRNTAIESLKFIIKSGYSIMRIDNGEII